MKARQHTYSAVFETVLGRQVLEDLARTFAVDTPGFSPEPTTHAYNTGRKDVILHIRSILSRQEPGTPPET